MLTAAFWRATAERAVKTFAQSLVALFAANQTGILDVDWPASLSTAGMATLLSVLTSIGSAGIGPTGPSIAGETTTPGRHRRDEGGAVDVVTVLVVIVLVLVVLALLGFLR